MGANVSQVSRLDMQRHNEIEMKINQDRIKNQSIFRLLLLGKIQMVDNFSINYD